jgi:hypothetical protein
MYFAQLDHTLLCFCVVVQNAENMKGLNNQVSLMRNASAGSEDSFLESPDVVSNKIKIAESAGERDISKNEKVIKQPKSKIFGLTKSNSKIDLDPLKLGNKIKDVDFDPLKVKEKVSRLSETTIDFDPLKVGDKFSRLSLKRDEGNELSTIDFDPRKIGDKVKSRLGKINRPDSKKHNAEEAPQERLSLDDASMASEGQREGKGSTGSNMRRISEIAGKLSQLSRPTRSRKEDNDSSCHSVGSRGSLECDNPVSTGVVSIHTVPPPVPSTSVPPRPIPPPPTPPPASVSALFLPPQTADQQPLSLLPDEDRQQKSSNQSTTVAGVETSTSLEMLELLEGEGFVKINRRPSEFLEFEKSQSNLQLAPVGSDQAPINHCPQPSPVASVSHTPFSSAKVSKRTSTPPLSSLSVADLQPEWDYRESTSDNQSSTQHHNHTLSTSISPII